MNKTVNIRKKLSANDLGLTGSHQVGILVPKSVKDWFPPLDEEALNPDSNINISIANGAEFKCRYIHYNNKLMTESGTRDEYRITRMTELLRTLRPSIGDHLEFEHIGDREFTVALVPADAAPVRGVIEIDLSRGWMSIKYQ